MTREEEKNVVRIIFEILDEAIRVMKAAERQVTVLRIASRENDVRMDRVYATPLHQQGTMIMLLFYRRQIIDALVEWYLEIAAKYDDGIVRSTHLFDVIMGRHGRRLYTDARLIRWADRRNLGLEGESSEDDSPESPDPEIYVEPQYPTSEASSDEMAPEPIDISEPESDRHVEQNDVAPEGSVSSFSGGIPEVLYDWNMDLVESSLDEVGLDSETGYFADSDLDARWDSTTYRGWRVAAGRKLQARVRKARFRRLNAGRSNLGPYPINIHTENIVLTSIGSSQDQARVARRHMRRGDGNRSRVRRTTMFLDRTRSGRD